MLAAIPFTIEQRHQLLGTFGRQHRLAGIVIHQGGGEGGEQLHMGGARLIGRDRQHEDQVDRLGAVDPLPAQLLAQGSDGKGCFTHRIALAVRYRKPFAKGGGALRLAGHDRSQKGSLVVQLAGLIEPISQDMNGRIPIGKPGLQRDEMGAGKTGQIHDDPLSGWLASKPSW